MKGVDIIGAECSDRTNTQHLNPEATRRTQPDKRILNVCRLCTCRVPTVHVPTVHAPESATTVIQQPIFKTKKQSIEMPASLVNDVANQSSRRTRAQQRLPPFTHKSSIPPTTPPRGKATPSASSPSSPRTVGFHRGISSGCGVQLPQQRLREGVPVVVVG